ncbi:hypothetical protein [Pedobacter sp.]|uniref:hypothetical protein n=1 Tax=Pedobacter sp. TaxID=1411316 RepID=UPI003D7FE142
MFRSYIAFLLICTIISASFSRYFVYAGYEFNKNYIVSTLCENRDKPVMQCNGKCYLAKKLKQEAEKEKNQEQQSKKTQFQEAFFTENFVIYIPLVTIKSLRTTELPFALPKYAAVIFQPPQV